MATTQATGTSEDTRTIVTVILLIFAYPIGLIVMWVWTHWPKWLKIILSLPVILFFIGMLATIVLLVANPTKKIDKSNTYQPQEYQQTVTVTPEKSY